MHRVSVLLCVCLSIAIASASFSTPSPPLDEVYRRYFWNIPDGDFCTATANVHQKAVPLGGFGRQRILAGCQTANALQDNMLFVLTIAELSSIRAASLSGSIDGTPDFTLAAKMMQSILPSSDASDGIALVFDNPRNASVSIPYQFVWGTLQKLERLTDHAPVRALVLADGDALDDTGMSLGSPIASCSPYGAPHNWSYGLTAIIGDGFEWSALHATVLLLPAKQMDWGRLIGEARYNRAAVSRSSGYVSPQKSLQSVFPMYLFQYEQPSSDISEADLNARLPDTCLTQPIPNCLPIGGESIWATTRLDQPSLIDEPQAVVRMTTSPQRNILVVVSATSTAPFHQNVPAASTASTIAGSLALMAALRPLMNTYLRSLVNASSDDDYLVWQPSQIVFLFTSADDYDLVGSGRFARDLFQGVNFCSSAANNKTQVSCLIPFTRTTNFTSMNVTDFSHIIHLDQIGVGSSVWHHFDGTDATENAAHYDYKSNPQQSIINQRFQQNGAQPSSEPQLPPGPLFAFYRSVSHKNAELAATVSVTSSWASRWSASRNFSSLSTISGFDGRYTNTRFQSSKDRKEIVNVTLISRTAQVVLDTITSILRSEYDDFKASGFPTGYSVTKTTLDESLPPSAFQLRIDESLTQSLFDCFSTNLACSFTLQQLQIQGLPGQATPNYYPSVFGFEAQTTLPQQILFYATNYFFQDNSSATTSCGSCPRYSTCLRGSCVRQQAFYHHAVSPALNFVRNGNVYFVEATEATTASVGGSLVWGLDPRLLQKVWIESFWSNNLGARTAMTATAAATWWAPLVGLIATVVPPAAFFAASRMLRN